MQSDDALGWSESEVRDQEVEINAEIPGGGYSAAGHGVAKSFDIPLQSIHKPILPFPGPDGDAGWLRPSSMSGQMEAEAQGC